MKKLSFAGSRWLIPILSVVLLLLAGAPPPVYGATFIVNSVLDTSDSNPGDGVCSNGGGGCTLRAAIEETNALAGYDTIAFNVGGGSVQTIAPGSALPTIADPVTMDGTTQPGYSGTPIIQLNGTNAGAGAAGISIGGGGGGSTIRGLVINRFDGNGVELSGAGNNVIEGNYVGTDFSGANDLGNNLDGIFIEEAAGNTIGGTAAGARNVISGNGAAGLTIVGSSADGNLVQGNFIGTDAAGTSAVGNDLDGIYVEDAPGNTIGGGDAGERNVISGNGNDGIEIFGNGAAGNAVQGNFIGADASGGTALANTVFGVSISDAPANVIGGPAEMGNIISGNTASGVYIEGAGASGNIVEGNFIGTNAGGADPLGNGEFGIMAIGSSPNSIGRPEAGNTIAFNALDGIAVFLLPPFSTSKDISANAIYGNGELGIDLDDDGVTPNDAGDGDTGGNALQNYPVLNSAESDGAFTFVEGSLNSAADTEFRIEFFANELCDPSDYGEGRLFLGATLVQTDGNGDVDFDASIGAPAQPGHFITATATGPNGNTSEFSQCREVEAAPGTPTPTPTPTPGPQVVLDCGITGDGGDSPAFEGYRFTVGSRFSAVEMRLAASVAGSYAFTVELRRSMGFVAPVEASAAVRADLPNYYDGVPYGLVRFQFPTVAVSGRETFTLKLTGITGPGYLVNEVKGAADPCPDVQETERNDVADPAVRVNEPYFVVLLVPASGGRLWGDFDCSGGVTIGDAQKIARDLIDIEITQSPGCPAPRGEVSVDGTPRLWGDLDCMNGVTIGDAQKTARNLIDLPITQANGCPAPGQTVEVSS